MPDMNIMARRVVQRALDAGAAIDPIRDFPDILRLHRLAEEITRPPIVEHLDILDQPVVVGDLPFYRLSWAYREWLLGSAHTWWRRQGDLLDLAYAWAMVHARDKSALATLGDPRRAEKSIRSWARATSVNYEAVMAACAWLLRPLREPDPVAAPDNAPTPDTDDRAEMRRSAGPVMMTLLTETDKPLDYWLYEVPAEVTDAALQRIRANWQRDQAALAAALGKRAWHHADSWHVEATKRFNGAAKAFYEKYAPEKPTEVQEAEKQP